MRARARENLRSYVPLQGVEHEFASSVPRHCSRGRQGRWVKKFLVGELKDYYIGGEIWRRIEKGGEERNMKVVSGEGEEVAEERKR